MKAGDLQEELRDTAMQLADVTQRSAQAYLQARPAGTFTVERSAYHIVAIGLLDADEATVQRLYILLAFIASVTVLATIWSRFFQRGPLEWLMGRATGIARGIQ